jgi:SRSO17 transposase
VVDVGALCGILLVCLCVENGLVADPDAVSMPDLKEWSAEFGKVLGRIEPLFVHASSRKHVEQYLRGLLAPIERKNGWTIAEYVGEKEPKAMQRFLNLAQWDADALRDLVCDYTIEHLNDPQGILVADPAGFAKKGRKSAGVQRQYSGTLGRIDNCQIATFLAYVTTRRDRVLIDRELYIPKDSWFADPDRCAEAAIPEDLTFATRPRQVMAMIERVRWSSLSFAWFTADEEFGQNPDLRTYLEQAEIAYVMAVPKNTVFTGPTAQQIVLSTLARRLAPHDWQRRACGIGTKGFRVYDWALLDSDDPDHQYLIRRSLDGGELAFYHCFNPRHEGFGELVRVAGARWPIEECFEATKSGIGLDDYQVRLYHAWYRHITLAMLAHAFLTVCARQHKNKKGNSNTQPENRNPHDQQ